MNRILDIDAPKATVFGGSGFIGRYIVRRLVSLGWRVRVGVRNPNDAIFLKTYGEVGQVELMACSITDRKSVSACIDGSDFVINAVAGLLNETSRKKIEQFYLKGPEIITLEAKKGSVKRLIHISALGADETAESFYSRYKRRGEQKVLEIFPGAVVLRPSVVFGNEDRFFNRYASMATYSFFLPVIGENTKFQPVYVDDVAQAVERVLGSKKFNGIFEIGGPDIFTHRELINKMLSVIRRKRLVVNIPFTVAGIMATAFRYIEALSLGLLKPPFSSDNVSNLKIDNIVQKNVKSLKDLKIEPKNLDTVIPNYLYSYRPYGQYNEMTESSKRQ